MDWEKHYRRYQDCQRYVAWSDYDVQQLRSAGPMVEPYLPALAEDFYQEIERHSHTSRIITGGKEQIKRLKQALLGWLGDLFSGNYDRDYLRRRWQVGWRHAGIGLEQAYTITAVSRLRTGLLTALEGAWRNDPADLLHTARSLNKLLDLDLAIIDDAYRTARLKSERAAAQCELDARERQWHSGMQLAARVHESLLPGAVRHPQIEIDVRYVPVEGIGGDYCQVLFPSDSCCYVTMCDVCGHGIGPALLATRFSSEVRHLVFEQLPPSDIVSALNTFVWQHFREANLFITFFAARFGLAQGQLTYSGAGHPAPLLLRNTERIETLPSGNIPIGVAEDCLSNEPESTVQVVTGDRFLFFTDGLIDAGNKMLDEERLAKIARRASVGSLFDMADCMLEQISDSREGPALDDLTLIIAELK